MTEEMSDVRLDIFQGHREKRVKAALVAEGKGILSGISRARSMMVSLGLSFASEFADGDSIWEGQEIARVMGDPLQISKAEERIIGTLSKASGIATAAGKARKLMGSQCQVVSGGWKKMPMEIKEMVRQAIREGGVSVRISDAPFVYLDKNYVRILGGVKSAIEQALTLKRLVVIQIRGETKAIKEEAIEAVHAGAGIIMVDTGRWEDAAEVIEILKERELRSQVRIAFAGDISLDEKELELLSELDLDAIDIGYAILDGACLPMRFDVIEVA